MRQTQVFSGSSHPALADGICNRLGLRPAQAELTTFSNGETSVQLKTSIRDQDVFIVQSGSSKINDDVIELLIMISACKGGSAKSITAVMPYFPYCRQSKKKSQRGAITARMVANLLAVAGVNHVITIDLHANQMQGFFTCPIDNLVAEPLIANWIKRHIQGWENAVVVSKNAGGIKRVTSLADALKLSFGIVTTDSRRQSTAKGDMVISMMGSVVVEKLVGVDGNSSVQGEHETAKGEENCGCTSPIETPSRPTSEEAVSDVAMTPSSASIAPRRALTPAQRKVDDERHMDELIHPLSPITLVSGAKLTFKAEEQVVNNIRRSRSEPGPIAEVEEADEFTDERAKDVISARLIHGHVVEGLPIAHSPPFPAPLKSASGSQRFPRLSSASGTCNSACCGYFGGTENGDPPEHMTSSFMSTSSSFRTYGGPANTLDGAATSDDDEEEELQNPELETTVTLVGKVRGLPVILVDDMIDRSASWIAAAETVVKRGGATAVYCFATHGLFGDDCLAEMERCPEIEKIVVTNSFPIPPHKREVSRKLVVLDVAPLLAEAIRRNHHGESISRLFMHYD